MARKHARNLVRTRGKRVLNSYNRMVALYAYAQSGPDWRLWTYRTISARQAAELVAIGEAMPVTRMLDREVVVIGYQSRQPARLERPSPTTLTFGTMQAVSNAVGLPGARVTLSAWERAEIHKLRVWPLIGDTKACAVRPRISEAERRAAEKLLTPPATMRQTTVAGKASERAMARAA